MTKTWFSLRVNSELGSLLEAISEEFNAREKEDREQLLDDLALILNGHKPCCRGEN